MTYIPINPNDLSKDEYLVLRKILYRFFGVILLVFIIVSGAICINSADINSILAEATTGAIKYEWKSHPRHPVNKDGKYYIILTRHNKKHKIYLYKSSIHSIRHSPSKYTRNAIRKTFKYLSNEDKRDILGETIVMNLLYYSGWYLLFIVSYLIISYVDIHNKKMKKKKLIRETLILIGLDQIPQLISMSAFISILGIVAKIPYMANNGVFIWLIIFPLTFIIIGIRVIYLTRLKIYNILHSNS